MKQTLVILCMMALLGCNQTPVETKQNEKPVHERVNMVDWSPQTLLIIYEVDGHQYIANVNGGLVHSESCPCKK